MLTEIASLSSIFESNTDEKTKVSLILNLLKSTPNLVNHRLRNRSILQTAIVNQLPLLVRKLLKKHQLLVTLADADGNNAYHYAILHYDEAILTALIELVPQFLNEKNNEGKTALYIATEQEIVPAIKQLVQAKANIHEGNNEGVTAVMLARNKPFLLTELKAFNLDLNKVRQTFPTLSTRQINEHAISELAIQFTALQLCSTKTLTSDNKASPVKTSTPPETERISRSISSSYLSKIKLFKSQSTETATYLEEPSSELTLDTFRLGDIETLKVYLNNGGDPNGIIFLGRPLIIQAFHVASFISKDVKSNECLLAQVEMFKLLAKVAKLDNTDKHGLTILQHLQENTLTKITLLKETFRELNAEYIALMRQAHSRLRQFEETFEQVLYDAGLTLETLAAKNPSNMPTISEITENVDLEYAKICWDLCNGTKPSGSATLRSKSVETPFDKRHICHIVQGLLTYYSHQDILVMIRRFWDKFDTHQKLRANLIVKELIISDINQTTSHEDFDIHFKFHKDSNEQTMSEHGILLNAYLDEMHQIRSQLANNIIYQNYHILLSWLTAKECHYDDPAFEAVIKHAIMLKGHRKKAQVHFIADELRLSTIACFQKIKIHEFYDKTWSEKPNQSPHILECIKMTNAVSWYLQELILNEADFENRVKIISLFIQVAAALCHPVQSVGPNFICIMGIMSAFNASTISRLKDCFNALDKKTKEKLTELNTLIDPGRNYYWMQSFESASMIPLPHLGRMLSRVTFIYDGNKDVFSICEMLGIEFRSFQQLQIELSMHACLPTTNLYTALVHSTYLTDDERYHLSCLRFGIKITLDNASLTDVLSKMKEYLKTHNALPRIAFEGIEYEPQDAIKAFSFYLRKTLDGKPATIEHCECLLQSKKLLGDIVQITNIRYQISINYFYYYGRLPKLISLQTPMAASSLIPADASTSSPASLAISPDLVSTISCLLESKPVPATWSHQKKPTVLINHEKTTNTGLNKKRNSFN